MSYRHPNTGKFISKAEYERLNPPKVGPLLPDLIADKLEHDEQEVSAMVERISTALDNRAAYERQKSPNGSHIYLRQVQAMFANSRTMAAFLCVLNADPELMFNRQRKSDKRANLKAFKKVRQLLDYVTGKTKAFERVSMALFASTIIAANKGVGWISSAEQELILSSEKVGSLPKAIREAIHEYQHKHMTLAGDSRPQACAFRCTFDNLNVYDFSREEFDNSTYSLGILVNMESPIVQYLNTVWELERFN